MTGITSLETYNSEMLKSMEDKTVFVKPYLSDIKYLVDFGCADGTWLKIAAQNVPNLDLIGLDMNSDMLEEAKKHLPNATFLYSTNPCVVQKFNYSEAALNLSSVLHEVYSYTDKENIQRFWKETTKNGYKYIFIRDMVSDLDNVTSSDIKDVEKIYSKTDLSEKIHDFESVWGSVTIKKNLIHFLLKYRYDRNWSREVKENYLPLSAEDIIRHLSDNYEIIYKEQFVLPFIHKQVMKDFEINIKDNTHIKIIARKKS